MDGEGTAGEPAVETRRYTGASRADAEAGFKLDWTGLSRRYRLLAETWDPDTHTLTVRLHPLAPGVTGERPGRAASA